MVSTVLQYFTGVPRISAVKTPSLVEPVLQSYHLYTLRHIDIEEVKDFKLLADTRKLKPLP